VATLAVPKEAYVKNRIGLLTLSDARSKVHQNLLAHVDEYNKQLISALEATGEVEVVYGTAPINHPEAARHEATRLLHASVTCTIFHQPIFGFPSYGVIVAQILPPPFLILAPRDYNFPSFNGLITIGAAFAQLDIPHERVWGNIDDKTVLSQILIFIRAASVVRKLRGQVYGLLGGRSMGLYGNAPAPNLWIRKFGIDVDHADEYEIVRRAEEINKDRVKVGLEWLAAKTGGINYDDDQLTRSKLERQVRAYLATKAIVADYGWDFLGVKCHFEMSEYFVTQCLTASLLNDPYDWEGPKEPTIVSCEADSDGALTMQIMKLLTGRPVSLNDIRFFDRDVGLWVLVNCGASPTWFAKHSNDPIENLRKTTLVPAITKYAGGGAHVCFQYREGPVTIARLQRSGDSYQLVIINGQIEEKPNTNARGEVQNWPVAYARLNISEDLLVQNMNANHLHMVIGDFVKDLELVAKFMDIEVVKFEAYY
jgi:L-fucose/D-arabinose isomerase